MTTHILFSVFEYQISDMEHHKYVEDLLCTSKVPFVQVEGMNDIAWQLYFLADEEYMPVLTSIFQRMDVKDWFTIHPIDSDGQRKVCVRNDHESESIGFLRAVPEKLALNGEWFHRFDTDEWFIIEKEKDNVIPFNIDNYQYDDTYSD